MFIFWRWKSNPILFFLFHSLTLPLFFFVETINSSGHHTYLLTPNFLWFHYFSIDEVCPVCRKACLDTFGEHVVHCKELPDFKYKHDFVINSGGREYRWRRRRLWTFWLTHKIEDRHLGLQMLWCTNGLEENMHVWTWLGVSPLVSLGVGAFTVGQAALKAESSKVVKHEKSCSDNQHAFIPFAFDTFGFLESEVVDLLHKVQSVMHSNVMSQVHECCVYEDWFCHPKRSSGVTYCPSASYSCVSNIDIKLFY